MYNEKKDEINKKKTSIFLGYAKRRKIKPLYNKVRCKSIRLKIMDAVKLKK